MIQFNLFEPTQITSFSNKRYFITFLNKFSKWLEIECLLFKNNAFKTFKHYLIKKERNSFKKLKTLRTNNKTETYNFCFKKRIKSEKIASYAYEQVDAAEYINLRLLNKIWALLFIAKLSIKFWAEALYAVVYLYNWISYALLNYRSLYEIKYGKKPNLENIKIWGSIVYNRIDNAKKLDKWVKL